MKALSKSDILGATVLPRERVAIPELNGFVYVRGMTGTERASWESKLIQGRGPQRTTNLRVARETLVVSCTVDEAGHRVFNETEVAQLGLVRVDVLDRIYEVAARLSRITSQDVDELGEASSATASDASSMPMPSSSGVPSAN